MFKYTIIERIEPDMKTYGYIRVYSIDRNEDRQIIAMQGLSIPESQLYIDKQSGKDFNRPSYKALLKEIRTGDLLYVVSIDRLGRNYDVNVKYKLKKGELKKVANRAELARRAISVHSSIAS